MCAYPLVIVHFDSFERYKQLATITPDFHRELSCGLLQLRLILSCGWIQVVAARVPATGYKLRLCRVPAAGYKLRLNPSYGWIDFRRLDTGCGQLRTMADLSSGSWIRVTADYILRLTWVPAAGYDLRLIPSCDWLRVTDDLILRLTRVRRLDSTCGWPIL